MDLNPLNIFKFLRQFNMNKREKANEVVKEYVLWSLGAGLVPVPILDIAAVTTVQIGMVKKLCELYEVPYDESSGKAVVTALISSTVASFGASMVKAIPVVGALVGGASMAILSGGASYAVGQVFINHFEGGGTLTNLNTEAAKKMYAEELERGKAFAEKLQKEYTSRFTSKKEDKQETHEQQTQAQAQTQPQSGTDDAFAKLEKLNDLRVKGIITDAEFNAKKAELLSSL